MEVEIVKVDRSKEAEITNGNCGGSSNSTGSKP